MAGVVVAPPLTRAYYLDYSTFESNRYSSPDELIKEVNYSPDSNGFIIVENIHASWITKFQAAWSIESSFFENHKKNPIPSNRQDSVFHDHKNPLQGEMWEAIFNGQRRNEYDPTETCSSVKIHGIVEYQDWEAKGSLPGTFTTAFGRRCEQAGDYPISTNTAISYCRINRNRTYLFLVDSPLDKSPNFEISDHRQSRLPRTILRLPYSPSRGGLVIPQLYTSLSSSRDAHQFLKFSLFESLIRFFRHNWLYHLLFQTEDVVWPNAFVYELASSMCLSNLNFLDREIKRISFNDLREPDLEVVNKVLHNHREDLYHILEMIAYNARTTPTEVKDWFAEFIRRNSERNLGDLVPPQSFTQMSEDAKTLSRFLMDSFQLLMSTVNTRDAKNSLEQNKKGALLTRLLFLYAPLSFVTAIFGMNTAEINDSPLSSWIVVVVLVITIICTVLIFLGWRFFDEKRETMRWRERLRSYLK